MLRFWPFRHLGAKLFSIAAALVLWVMVSGEETVERGLRVPLELQQSPSGLEISGELPTTVDIRIRGGSTALSRLAPGDVVAVLDLRSARPGQRVFPLTPEQVRAPFGISIVQVTPSAIAMMFEKSVSRRVPVRPAVDGEPAPGFVVGKMDADPATVEVSGPESAVKRASEAVTEPVPVTGARERVQETVTLGVLDPALRISGAKSAVVTVAIQLAPLERTLRGRPVHRRSLGAALDAQVEPATVDVMLRGNRDALARLDPDDIVAYVDLTDVGAGEYAALPVHVDAPDRVGVTRVAPASVQVR
ncbi:MAG TPA: CdaR family protein, partial [Vicinamibacterales bacterium]|nr:CdaR family protein [Vicinamibacterales bacterium]